VILDQDGCRYIPMFRGHGGQPLEIKNSDSVAHHNIKALAKKNRGFNVSQPNAEHDEERQVLPRRR